jgi:branched-chain amino acid transport system substrate-binding protein
VIGIREVLGDNFQKMVVKSATYEATDTTVESQILSLQSAGVDTFVLVAIPKFAAQAIRKVYDIGWKPALFFLNNVSASAGTVINPVGAEKAVGLLTGNFVKDPTDPAWNNDPGMDEWRAFMRKPCQTPT